MSKMSSNVCLTKFVHFFKSKHQHLSESERPCASPFFFRRRRKIGIHSGLWPDPSIPRLHLNTCHLAKTRNCQPGIAWWVANSCFAAGTMKQNCDDKVTCQKVQRKPEYVINRQVAQVISPNICRAVRVQANYVEMITMLFCVDPRSFSSLLSCSKSLQLFGCCSWTVGGHALKTMRERGRACNLQNLEPSNIDLCTVYENQKYICNFDGLAFQLRCS